MSHYARLVQRARTERLFQRQVPVILTSATLRLPHAQLGKPALDTDRSYAVSKQRGLLDRLGDFFSDNPNSEQAVQKLAVRHIGDAAKESELTKRAETNTTNMLEGLLRSLGFKEVKVSFDA